MIGEDFPNLSGFSKFIGCESPFGVFGDMYCGRWNFYKVGKYGKEVFEGVLNSDGPEEVIKGIFSGWWPKVGFADKTGKQFVARHVVITVLYRRFWFGWIFHGLIVQRSVS